MSSISVTHKIKALSVLNNRNVILIALAALVTTLVAISAVSVLSPAAKAFDYNAYMLHRQGEWLSVPIPVNNAEAYQIFRLGEWASVNVPTMDITAYHLSERTLIDPNIGFSIYLLSERTFVTFVDAQAGMAAYLNSERTSVPVNFTKYQRSEWFGE